MSRSTLIPACFTSAHRPARHVFGTVLGIALLAGCGGGGSSGSGGSDDGGSTPAPTAATSFTRGAISGFGSVIVNGVRFEDESAKVEDDDGDALSRDDLRLGMEVEIEGGKITDGRGSASHIRVGSALVGAVQSVDTAGATFTLLDQTVRVGTSTVFDDDFKGGLSAVKVGQVLEVHAQYDAASDRYTASRIDDEDDAKAYKIRGIVSDLDTSAQRFRIGSTLISYAGVAAADVPDGLADGETLSVRLEPTPVDGSWQVVGLRESAPPVQDHDEAELQGRITAFTSSSAFSVGGIEVDASAARFPDGQTGLKLGAKVEVEGSMVAGVLVANEVDLDDDDDRDDRDDDIDDDNNDGIDDDGYELHGTIGALDTTARTFVLRGVTVSYAGNVRYDDLSAATLADGLKVEVNGQLSADGTEVVATEIELDD